MLEIERKWLLSEEPNFSKKSLIINEIRDVTQFYLATSSDIEVRLYKSVGSGGTSFKHTYKNRLKGIVSHETICDSDEAEFEMYRNHPLRVGEIIQKKRYFFEYKDQQFELDKFIPPVDYWMLELELKSEDQEVELPPFLSVGREVSTEVEYTNLHIAQHGMVDTPHAV